MAKVLLVEDDNNLREIYQARLSAEGYDLSAAQNGEEALVLAKQNKPDLIISDVMMPRISGFEMLDILRNTDELKNTKVIMLTALGQAEDQSRADNLGADKYLVKSQVTLEDIVNAAKNLLGDSSPAIETTAPEPQTAVAPAEPVPAIATAPEPAAPLVSAVTSEPTPEMPVVPPTTLVEATPAPEPAIETIAPVMPLADASAAPASVNPQPDTTVVVPPAPANPTPPAVTTTPMPAPAPAASTPPAPELLAAPSTSAVTDDTTAPPVVSVPAPATPPTVASTGADVTAQSSQSLEAEEAVVQSQINNFASHGLSAAPPASEPAESADNDAAIASAVNQLNADSQVVAAPSNPNPDAMPTPTAPASTPASAESVGGTKVIQPLNDVATTGPNLEELLAREEAKETSNDAPVSDQTTSVNPTTNQNNNGGVDPNSIAL